MVKTNGPTGWWLQQAMAHPADDGLIDPDRAQQLAHGATVSGGIR